jgi:ankyrin repeat protein
MAAAGVDRLSRTPVAADQEAIVLLLLAANADIGKGKSDTGATSIHIAAQEGHVSLVQLLAAHGADVDHTTNDDGDHPVWYGETADVSKTRSPAKTYDLDFETVSTFYSYILSNCKMC